MNNHIQQALKKLESEKINKRRLADLQQQFQEATGPLDFCLTQAQSLALLATPDIYHIYRLANNLVNQLEIGDRFYLKPLFRALTFDQTAYILALSENEVKVIGLFREQDPEPLEVPGLPESAISALSLPSLTASHKGPENPVDGTERKMRLENYAKKVNEALTPLARSNEAPFILASTEPLASIFRSQATIGLAEETIALGPDKIPDHELVKLARPILDDYYGRELDRVRDLFEQRSGQKRVALDGADVAKAATFGLVDLAMVDFDNVEPGVIDDLGNIVFTSEAGSYGLVDEIVKRSMENGARVIAVRDKDMVGDTGVAAILRYPLEAGKSI